ncbi:MAG: lipase [Acidimicrobiales bacterium]
MDHGAPPHRGSRASSGVVDIAGREPQRVRAAPGGRQPTAGGRQRLGVRPEPSTPAAGRAGPRSGCDDGGELGLPVPAAGRRRLLRFALTYGERPDFPYVGGVLRMQDSAVELDAFVDRVLGATGAPEVDLVGHSEGTVMPQWWLKFLGGADVAGRYVALTPLYDGTSILGFDRLVEAGEQDPEVAASFEELSDALCGSCRQFLRGSDFFDELYGDGVVAVPGVEYTTIMTRYDEAVVPWTSGHLDAPDATNIVLQDVCASDLSEHGLVPFDPVVVRLVMNALDPEHAVEPTCGSLLGVQLGPIGL